MYYHGWTEGTVGYQNGGFRSMRIDRLTFDASGRPVLRGGPSVTPMAAPSK